MKKSIGAFVALPAILLTTLLLLPGAARSQMEQIPGVETGEANGIPYLSGGVGEGERQELEHMKNDYNLKLIFAITQGNYLALVDVLIKDASGNTVLKVESKGPWFYAKLPPGRYMVEATTLRGHAKQKQVQVSSGKMEQVLFEWKRKISEAEVR